MFSLHDSQPAAFYWHTLPTAALLQIITSVQWQWKLYGESEYFIPLLNGGWKNIDSLPPLLMT